MARWWGVVTGAMAALGLLVGCDSQRIAQLEVGVSTESDVRAQFGEPVAVYPEPDGGKTLEYPRQPEGQVNYMITLGPDGRLRLIDQVLREEVFAQLTPGLDQAQVRRLLGRPASTQFFVLRNEELWEWRYLNGPESRVFQASFDPEGRLLHTATQLDPREAMPGGK
jgi:outer membrane protein assembly factor BamE (lipoprotein component of BamABCDE complex)